ncbi:MAG: hypothetical protein NC120_02115 [Ruminococcus sp.]|nr:hypothetical protein [Ruminococcus sp.]
MNHADSGLAHGTNGSPQLTLENGEAEIAAKKIADKLAAETAIQGYNPAKSKSIRHVIYVSQLQGAHSMPMSNSQNSVVQNYIGGKLITERYFGENGKPYLDIDYTNHGNPKMHPTVPHEHSIKFVNGEIKREKIGKEINK